MKSFTRKYIIFCIVLISLHSIAYAQEDSGSSKKNASKPPAASPKEKKKESTPPPPKPQLQEEDEKTKLNGTWCGNALTNECTLKLSTEGKCARDDAIIITIAYKKTDDPRKAFEGSTLKVTGKEKSLAMVIYEDTAAKVTITPSDTAKTGIKNFVGAWDKKKAIIGTITLITITQKPPPATDTIEFLMSHTAQADPTNYVINVCFDKVRETEKYCQKDHKDYFGNWMSLNLACFFENNKGELAIKSERGELAVKLEQGRSCRYFEDIKDASGLQNLLKRALSTQELLTFEDFENKGGFVPQTYPKEYILALSFITLKELIKKRKNQLFLMFVTGDTVYMYPYIRFYTERSLIFIKPPQNDDRSTKVKVLNKLRNSDNFHTLKGWQSIKPESIEGNKLSLHIPNTDNTQAIELIFDKKTYGKSDTDVYSVQVITNPLTQQTIH